MSKSHSGALHIQGNTTDRPTFLHNMQPPAGILNVFSRLNYKTHYAIAEFVDNSTQSYLLHKEELAATETGFVMSVTVDYDSDNAVLTVTDNAYGMEKDRFLDAITLDAKNNDQLNSRNEFGMGLKTAASWFGNKWTVSSTALGSRNRYTATVDIPYLQSTGNNDVAIAVTPADPLDHGTTITIEQVTKGLGPRAIGKTRAMLASMYRRDLDRGDITITVKGQAIKFEKYPILKFREKEWKKPLDFEIKFAGHRYRIRGFVGIMNPGGFPKAGFALFRRNRVIIGGEDHNYKPQEIFQQAQSQISLKLFGELDMDDFPVNQAKDGFIWDNGLEDEFISQLKLQIADYITIAKLSKEARVEEERFSSDASSRVEAEVSKAIEALNASLDDAVEGHDFLLREISLLEKDSEFDALAKLFAAEMAEQNQNNDEELDDYREYSVKINPIKVLKIITNWKIGSDNKWFETQEGAGEVHLTININHPFFKPYSNDQEFQTVLEKFVIAFIIAEEAARENADVGGFIPTNSIRKNMNRILHKLA